MSKLSRRTFVNQTSATLAGLTVASTLKPQRVLGANNKINIGTIGLRSQGFSVTRSHMKTGRVNVVAICDVDKEILERRKRELDSEYLKTYTDFRDLLNDDRVDAVIIGTPDHWHAIMAIMACQAGKDVYIEKPCAKTIYECRRIAEAAQKYNRIVQHGTQQRSAKHFQEARDYVRSGNLGEIALVRNWAILGRGSIGNAPVTDPPDHLDYEMWTGPAPKKPYTKNRSHYNWRFMWDIGTGDMGNWGVHWMDIALWTMGVTWPDAFASMGGKFIYDDDKQTPDTQATMYDYPSFTMLWELRMWSKRGVEGRGTGTAFYGDKQTLIVNRSGWEAYSEDGEKVVASGKPSNDMSVAHANDFLDSIISRKPPIADIANGHISAAVSIFGNVAWKAEETLRYDPKAEKLDKSQFNELLTREYHNGWVLPKV